MEDHTINQRRKKVYNGLPDFQIINNCAIHDYEIPPLTALRMQGRNIGFNVSTLS